MSRQLRVKTHGSSLRLYHLWLPLPVPLTLLRNYVNEKSSAQDSGIGSDRQCEESDIGSDRQCEDSEIGSDRQCEGRTKPR